MNPFKSWKILNKCQSSLPEQDRRRSIIKKHRGIIYCLLCVGIKPEREITMSMWMNPSHHFPSHFTAAWPPHLLQLQYDNDQHSSERFSGEPWGSGFLLTPVPVQQVSYNQSTNDLNQAIGRIRELDQHSADQTTNFTTLETGQPHIDFYADNEDSGKDASHSNNTATYDLDVKQTSPDEFDIYRLPPARETTDLALIAEMLREELESGYNSPDSECDILEHEDTADGVLSRQVDFISLVEGSVARTPSNRKRQRDNTDVTSTSYSPPAKRHFCHLCDKHFSSKNNLNNHIRSHSGSTDRPFKCQYCSKCFTQMCSLKTHVRLHTGERPYQCPTCHRRFADVSTCSKHQRIHTGEKPYSCDVCGKSFSQSGNMLRHKRSHITMSMWMNPSHHFTSHFTAAWPPHLLQSQYDNDQHTSERLPGKSCSSGFLLTPVPAQQVSYNQSTCDLKHVIGRIRELDQHSTDQTTNFTTLETGQPHTDFYADNEDSRQDPIRSNKTAANALNVKRKCPNEFDIYRLPPARETTDLSLIVEMLREELESGYNSPDSDCDILDHEDTDDGVLSRQVDFISQVEGSVARTPSNRKRQRDNTDFTSSTDCPPAKRHFCHLSEKHFSGKNNLNNHIRSHPASTDRPFKCPHCSKCFTQMCSLKTHIRLHTGERPYQCPTCHRRFADASTCNKHQRIHTGEKPYSCDVCGKSFSQSGNMLRHKRSHQAITQTLQKTQPEPVYYIYCVGRKPEQEITMSMWMNPSHHFTSHFTAAWPPHLLQSQYDNDQHNSERLPGKSCSSGFLLTPVPAQQVSYNQSTCDLKHVIGRIRELDQHSTDQTTNFTTLETGQPHTDFYADNEDSRQDLIRSNKTATNALNVKRKCPNEFDIYRLPPARETTDLSLIVEMLREELESGYNSPDSDCDILDHEDTDDGVLSRQVDFISQVEGSVARTPSNRKRQRDNRPTEITSSTDCPPAKRHFCHLSEKHFSSKNNLSNHIRSHPASTDRPFKCPHCSKCFTQMCSLKTHIRLHTGERPYQCPTCHRRFADISTCNKHQRIHTGEKPYSCDVCGKSFSQSGNMLRHRRSHHT
ncbi:uncharacterized protein LOC106153658 [Lingula anatina]|uniref:Uncharacterized protein LOC106153658 n=1 Tax=Lingula anatina TaxID=7574 RepID=A0A1S3HDE4_LINAN|nr:uncharacterized protein LOC106153658 [Lingula anatina]|eukprot:XP_013383114.1 uncharacterized protein LOC106153658 [Lingula anatina]